MTPEREIELFKMVSFPPNESVEIAEAYLEIQEECAYLENDLRDTEKILTKFGIRAQDLEVELDHSDIRNARLQEELDHLTKRFQDLCDETVTPSDLEDSKYELEEILENLDGKIETWLNQLRGKING